VWVVAVAAAGPTMMRVWRQERSGARDWKQRSSDYRAVHRFSAYAIDLVVIAVLITVVLVVGTRWEDKLVPTERFIEVGAERFPFTDDVSSGDIERGLVEWLLAFHALMILYAGLVAMRRPPGRAQTIGKTMTHLRVTRVDARPLSRRAAFQRDVFMKWLVFGLPTLLVIGGPVWATLVFLPDVSVGDFEDFKPLAGAVGTVMLLSLPAVLDGLWTFRSERRALHDLLSDTQVESTRGGEVQVHGPVSS
jgi:uncharacterized RDD family membrane protein YckC